MIAELDRLTRAEFGSEPATHLDYAEFRVASGSTILQLAGELSAVVGAPIHREALSKYLASLERESDTEGTLARARARGAHAIAEHTLALADSATDETVQATTLQIRTRQWLAERWNAAELGQLKGPSVTVNINSLMLEALRQPVPTRAIASAIAEDAVILSDDTAIAYLSA